MGMAAFGAKLQAGDGGGPETFADVAEITSISGPSFKVDVEDVTNNQSVEAWEEVVATIIRTDPITIEANFVIGDTTGQDALLTALGARSKDNYKIIFPDAGNTEFAFAAYVVGYNTDLPHDSKAEVQIELKPTGKPTLWV